MEKSVEDRAKLAELGARVLEILEERAWARSQPLEFAHTDADAMRVIEIRARSLGLLGKEPSARAWTEYDAVAEWCATRGIAGHEGDRLPEMISTECKSLISDDPAAFRERIRAHTYARACKDSSSKEGGAS